MEFIEYLKEQDAALAIKERELVANPKYVDGRNEKLTDVFLQRERIATALNLFDDYKKSTQYQFG